MVSKVEATNPINSKLDNKIRQSTIKSFASCICMPINSYLQGDETYTDDQGWLMEHLPDRLTDDMERNSRHDFRRHPDDPEPSYAIITDTKTGKRSIAEFQHVPYTTLEPRIICTLDPRDDPGDGGHLIPLKSGLGLWFVLVGGNLKKMIVYHAELDDFADWETLISINGEDGTPPRPIEFGAAHLFEIDSSDYNEKFIIYFVGGYGKYGKGDFGTGPLTTRRDILMLELELDCFMKTYPPTPKVRGAKWTSFDCVDVARLVHKNPNFPLSVGSFSMSTNRPNMHQKRKSKRIHQKIMSKSSKALVIMGDSDEIVMIPLYDLTGATNFFHYHPNPDAHDDLVSCTIPYRQFLGKSAYLYSDYPG